MEFAYEVNFSALVEEKPKYRHGITRPLTPHEHISPADLAYIGGLIDGEGSVWIGRNFDKRRNKYYPCAHIDIQMCDPEPVQFCRDTLGGYLGRRKRRTSSNRIVYVWTIQARMAGRAAVTLLPYLRIPKKRLKLMEIIEFYQVTPRAA